MRRDAGVVDEHVDAAEVAVDVLDQPVELLPVPDVAGVGARAAAVGAQRGGDLVAGVGLAADDDDLGAGLREPARDREPEPAGPAGDDGDAVGKVEAVAGSGSRLARAERPPPSGRALGCRRARRTRRRTCCRLRSPARRTRPASSSRSRCPSTSQTTSKGCSRTVFSGHRSAAISYAVARRPASAATIRSQRRSWSASRCATSSAWSVMSSPCPVCRRSSGIAAVRRRLSRYSTRARGRVPVGSSAG